MKQVVYLEISSWQGMSFGAIHYYGKLVGPRTEDGRKEVRLTKELSGAEAKYLSQKDDWHWEKGDKTDRFRDKGELIALALKTWHNHFPDAAVLVLGKCYVAEPQPVLDGSEEVKRQINILAHKAESERSEKAVDEICDKWGRIAELNEIEF